MTAVCCIPRRWNAIRCTRRFVVFSLLVLFIRLYRLKRFYISLNRFAWQSEFKSFFSVPCSAISIRTSNAIIITNKYIVHTYIYVHIIIVLPLNGNPNFIIFPSSPVLHIYIYMCVFVISKTLGFYIIIRHRIGMSTTARSKLLLFRLSFITIGRLI